MKINNKVFSNTLWLIVEKLINILGLIFITSYVAKYIGPDSFGKLSFATYFFSIIQTVAIWGSDTLCVKRLSKNFNSGSYLVSSISKMRVVIYLLLSLPVLVYMFFFSDTLSFYFSLAVSVSSFFYVQDVYSIVNDAMLRSKYNVYSNSFGLVVSLVIRYFIVFFHANILFLAIPIVIINLLPFLIRRYLHNKNFGKIVIPRSIDVKNKYLKFAFFSGLPLVVSSVSVAIYTNTSRLMLGTIESKSALGIYAVAITLGSAWGFVNNAFVTSITPKLYSSKSYIEAKNICSFMSQVIIIFTFGYLCVFLFAGKFLLLSLYGPAFISSYEVTIPLIISTGISALGMPSSRFIVHFSGYAFLGKKTLITCTIGFIITYFMVKKFGLFGAAYSTLIIEILSLTFFNYFFKKHSVFKMHIKVLDIKSFFYFLKGN